MGPATGLVELMESSVALESDVGVGTTIGCDIPVGDDAGLATGSSGLELSTVGTGLDAGLSVSLSAATSVGPADVILTGFHVGAEDGAAIGDAVVLFTTGAFVPAIGGTKGAAIGDTMGTTTGTVDGNA